MKSITPDRLIMISINLRNQFLYEGYLICQHSIGCTTFSYEDYDPDEKSTAIHNEMKWRLRDVSGLVITLSTRIEL